MSEVETLYVPRARGFIAYERRGTGPLVTLVQGLGMSGRMWLETPKRVVDAGFTVLTPDNRGTGRSSRPLPPYRMAAMADDVAAVIAHAGGGPSLVVGISLGGMIAQHLALRHPSLVRGLVLAATTCGLPWGRLPRPAIVSALIRGLLGDRRALPALRAALVHPQTLATNPDVFRQWDAMLAAEGVDGRAVLGQLGAFLGHNTFLALRRIRCPTEVMTGDRDVIVPTANARTLARRIPGATRTELPRAGHAFPLEHPTALVEGIGRVSQRAEAR